MDVQQLERAWASALDGLSGHVGIALNSLQGPVTSVEADEPHYAASTVKLAALGALLQGLETGDVRPGSAVAVRDRFASAVGGRFRLRQEDDQDDETWQFLGSLADLMCLADRMITVSGNLAAALILQIFILALYLDDRRGYPVFIAAMVLYAAVIAASGRILLPLLALAVAFVCGYLALSLYDYRLSLWARGEA